MRDIVINIPAHSIITVLVILEIATPSFFKVRYKNSVNMSYCNEELCLLMQKMCFCQCKVSKILYLISVKILKGKFCKIMAYDCTSSDYCYISTEHCSNC